MKNFYKAVPNYQNNTQGSSNAATGSSGTSSGPSKGSQQTANQYLNQAVAKAAQTGNTNKVTSQVNQMVQTAMTNKNSAERKNEMKNSAGNVMEMLQGAMTEAAHGRKSNGPQARGAMAAVKGYMEAASPNRAKNADMLNAIQESMNAAAFGGNSEFAWANAANKMQEAAGSQLAITAENASNQVGNQLFEAMQEAVAELVVGPNIVAMSGDSEEYNVLQTYSDMITNESWATSYGDVIQLLISYGENLPTEMSQRWESAFDVSTNTNQPRVPYLLSQWNNYKAEENHSNLLLARITAEADPYWSGGDTTLNLGGYMYDLLSPEENADGYTSRPCAFSYTNSGAWTPDAYDNFAGLTNWPQDNGTTWKLDESFNTGMTSDEKNYLYHKFGYESISVFDAVGDIQKKIEAGVKYLAGLVATDELGNQIINNVVDYGDLKTKHLTSINIAERKQAAPTNVTESSGTSWTYLPPPAP